MIEQTIATGRRKTSVARVYLRRGTGVITINKRPIDSYFSTLMQKERIYKPLRLTDDLKTFDILINAKGGGKSGQSGAILLGIARALVKYDEKNRPILRAHGCLTRDARMVERKKYGQPGARKKFQFSKR